MDANLSRLHFYLQARTQAGLMEPSCIDPNTLTHIQYLFFLHAISPFFLYDLILFPMMLAKWGTYIILLFKIDRTLLSRRDSEHKKVQAFGWFVTSRQTILLYLLPRNQPAISNAVKRVRVCCESGNIASRLKSNNMMYVPSPSPQERL